MTDPDPLSQGAHALHDNYPAALAALRQTRCPADEAPLLLEGALDDDGPPIFYCPNGHGHWSTNGRASAWYTNMAAARDRRQKVPLTWDTPGPTDPANPFEDTHTDSGRPAQHDAAETTGPGLYRPTATIEAMRFTGGPEAATAIIDWLLSRGISARYHGPGEDLAAGEHIAIYDIRPAAGPGDWVVRGITGHVWPVADDQFRERYIPAADQSFATAPGDRLIVRIPGNDLMQAVAPGVVTAIRAMYPGVQGTVIATDSRIQIEEEFLEQACQVLHKAYEQAATGTGWETNPASRKPWAEVPPANQATTRAAAKAVLEWMSNDAGTTAAPAGGSE